MVNEHKKPIQKAGPSTPVEVSQEVAPHVQVHHEDLNHEDVKKNLEGTGATIVGHATPPKIEDSGIIKFTQEPPKVPTTDTGWSLFRFLRLQQKKWVFRERRGLKNAA